MAEPSAQHGPHRGHLAWMPWPAARPAVLSSCSQPAGVGCGWAVAHLSPQPPGGPVKATACPPPGTHRWCCSLPGGAPEEPSKMTASASHPDLLGGWDTWAEAPAPTPAAEGRVLPVSPHHHNMTVTLPAERSEAGGCRAPTLVSPPGLSWGFLPSLLSYPIPGRNAQVPSAWPLPCLLVHA